MALRKKASAARGPGRPAKDPAEKSLRFTISLAPRVSDALDAIMREDGIDERSACVAKLVIEEAVRRRRRRS